ncbi:MAG: Crp/Fnr family transcriptional regulator [Clostridia bacterium]|nr:Crp/Fnr family transcriptional regulator [Clostridia bacterium]
MEENIIEKIKKCRLMEGVKDTEKILRCFEARKKNFSKGAEIVGYGEAPSLIILTKGSAISVSEDWFGNRNMISKIGESGVFGAAYVYAKHEISTRLVAAEDCEIISMNGEKMHSPCPNVCADHTRFLYNVLSLVSNNCVNFLEKVEHLSRRTMREKILAFLTAQSVKNNANSFIIPFSRQEFADYLAVDRCALSSELGRMKKDGLIDFYRSTFTIIKK